jgi:endonuclease YncB( thermonuclease family)
MNKKLLLALVAAPVALLTTACVPVMPGPAGPAPAATVTITRVIDGDTVETPSLPEDIRIIGIDTPERGHCGFNEASNLMRSLVQGQAAAIPGGARTDRDKWGRFLRYVDVNGVDVGRQMIESGWAHARYDSRDGYGRHPRQDAYVAADAAHNAPACGW